MQEVNHIIGTDLLDYSFKVEQAIKEGWTFSIENQYTPRAWPHMFEAWMVLSPISQVISKIMTTILLSTRNLDT